MTVKRSAARANTKVRVVGRIRPLSDRENDRGAKETFVSLSSDDHSDIIYDDKTRIIKVKEGPQVQKQWFELDAVFDKNSTQKELYVGSGAKKAVCEDIFKGFNCTLLAYGQTGAGKTHSMGTASHGTEIREHDGIIPRACHDLFESIADKCNGDAIVELSYLELYNEELRDLMVDRKQAKPLRIRESMNGEIYVEGLKKVEVKSPKEIGEFMKVASKRRAVAATAMNSLSSRSHAMCILRVKGVVDGADNKAEKFTSKLVMVDLAGSERSKKTGATGNRLKEGINVNKSLLVLGQVVAALAEKDNKGARKPPYRDSKLTRLLQDSLGGNSQTIFLACISPADYNAEESINVLRYATSARNIKNSAVRNVITKISNEEAMKLQIENESLKQQVKELEEAKKIQGEKNEVLAKQVMQLEETIDSITQDIRAQELETEVSPPSATSIFSISLEPEANWETKKNVDCGSSTISTESMEDSISLETSESSSYKLDEDLLHHAIELEGLLRQENIIEIEEVHETILLPTSLENLDPHTSEDSRCEYNKQNLLDFAMTPNLCFQDEKLSSLNQVFAYNVIAKDCKTSNRTRSASHQNPNNDANDYEVAMDEKSQCITDLEKQVENLRKVVSASEIEIPKLQAEVEKLREVEMEKDSLDFEIQNLAQQLYGANKDTVCARRDAAKFSNMLKESQNNSNRIYEDLDEKKKHITDLELQVECLQKLALKSEHDLQVTVEKLREETNQKKVSDLENCRLRQELHIANSSADCARRTAANFSDMLNEFQDDSNRKTEDLDKKSRRIKELEIQVEGLQKSVLESKLEIPRLKAEMEKLREENKDKDVIDSENRKLLEELDTAKNAADRAHCDAAKLSDMLKDFLEDSNRINEDLNILESHIEGLLESVSESELEIHVLKDEVENLREENKQKVVLDMENHKLVEELKVATSFANAATYEASTLCDKLKILENDATRKDEELDEKKKLIEDLMSQVEGLRKSVSVSAVDLSKMKVEMEKLREENEDKDIIDSENRKLLKKLDIAKDDADRARHAATKFSKLLKQFQDDAKNEKDEVFDIEYYKDKEEAMVSFVNQLLENNKSEMKKISDDFQLVIQFVNNIIKSCSFSAAAQQLGVDGKIRMKMLNTQVEFFKDNIANVERQLENETKSFEEIVECFKKQVNDDSKLPNAGSVNIAQGCPVPISKSQTLLRWGSGIFSAASLGKGHGTLRNPASMSRRVAPSPAIRCH